MHKVNVSIPNKYRSQSTQFKLFRSISAKVTFTEKNFDFDSHIRTFSGGFTAAKNSAADSDIRRWLGV